MNLKKYSAAALALALLTGISPAFASAQTLGVNARVDVGVTAGDTEHDDEDEDTDENDSSARAKVKAEANATSTVRNDKATTTPRGVGDEHRSRVAAFVHSLLSIADREGGLGAEVRAVARAQNEAASTTADAVVEVENRSKLKTLLIGTDYRNLGAIRKGLATTDKNIARLEAVLASTTDATLRTELEAQIDVLEDEKEDLVEFVEDHEDTFSVFGWFTKLFVNAEVSE